MLSFLPARPAAFAAAAFAVSALGAVVATDALANTGHAGQYQQSYGNQQQQQWQQQSQHLNPGGVHAPGGHDIGFGAPTNRNMQSISARPETMQGRMDTSPGAAAHSGHSAHQYNATNPAAGGYDPAGYIANQNTHRNVRDQHSRQVERLSEDARNSLEAGYVVHYDGSVHPRADGTLYGPRTYGANRSNLRESVARRHLHTDLNAGMGNDARTTNYRY